MRKDMESQEHRKAERIKFTIPISFIVRQSKYDQKRITVRAVSNDVSSDGFSFVVSYPVKKASIKIFYIDIPFSKDKVQKKYYFKGRICWNKGIKQTFTSIYKTGVCFINKSDFKNIRNLILKKTRDIKTKGRIR